VVQEEFGFDSEQVTHMYKSDQVRYVVCRCLQACPEFGFYTSTGEYIELVPGTYDTEIANVISVALLRLYGGINAIRGGLGRAWAGRGGWSAWVQKKFAVYDRLITEGTEVILSFSGVRLAKGLATARKFPGTLSVLEQKSRHDFLWSLQSFSRSSPLSQA